MLSATTTVPTIAVQNQMLADAVVAVQNNLKSFSHSNDFFQDLQTAFGANVTSSVAQNLAKNWESKSFQMPTIRVVAPSVLGDAWAGYAQSTNTIYMSQGLLTSASASIAASVLLEEYGHSVDARISKIDSPGDEGHIFAGLALGHTYTAADLKTLKASNDHATIRVNSQTIAIEDATISGDGGQGGTTQTVALSPGLNLVRFQWENFSIPDEFQILYQGKRLAGDVGLQSGGHQGQKVVVATSSSDVLTVKVTAPLEGTAWNFVVETLPFELNVDGALGDIAKVDVVQLLSSAGVSLSDAGLKADGFALKSESNNRGTVAKIDDYQKSLQSGQFYFAPTVTGSPLDYKQVHSDVGLGDSELTFTNNGQEILIKLHIHDGFSSSGNGAVTFGPMGNTKLDIYRQEQRLAYLGYQGAAGGGAPLKVDGVEDGNTMHAKRMYSVAVRSEFPSSVNPPGGVLNASTDPFKDNINSSDPPFWVRLSSIQGVTFNAVGRRYGTDHTGYVLDAARTNFGNYTINGVSRINGDGVFDTGGTSYSHDAGRGFDIGIGGVLFEVRGYQGVPGGYVKAPGGPDSIAVRDPNSPFGFRPGNVNNATDRANAVRAGVGINNPPADTLNGSTTAALALGLYQANCLVFTNTDVNVIRNKLAAFVNAAGGAIRIFYNDPRFLNTQVGGVTVGFSKGHFDHMHFNLPGALNQQPPAQAGSLRSSGVFAPALASLPPTAAIDLGRLTGPQSISGTLNPAASELLYRFQIGNFSSDDIESVSFDTLRDLSLSLGGLAKDADVQLVYDLNEDGVFGTDEVLYESATSGNAAESISAPQLPSGTYYVRVIRKTEDTPFNLSLSLATLPVPTDGAGDTVATAADLGTLGIATRTNFVGEVDAEDLFKFQITSVKDITFALIGLNQGDASLAVGKDNNGNGTLDSDEVIAYSDQEGNSAESLSLPRLAAGSYLAQVLRVSGNSNYQLQVSALTSVIPADQAGNSPVTAANLGTLTGPVVRNDFVGRIDPIDTYRFALSSLQSLQVTLSELQGDADLAIGSDANNNGILENSEILMVSQLGGTATDSLNLGGLPAGTYFVQVLNYLGDTTYKLSLTPGQVQGADLVVTRSDTTTSADLGSPFTYTINVTNNGPDAATNITLDEVLPNGLTLLSATKSLSASTIQVNGNQANGTIPSLASGASATFTFTVNSFIAGQLATTTTVNSGTTDFNLKNNTLISSKVVNQITSPKADLELTQTASNSKPKVGDTLTLTLKLTNQGPGTATVIKVKNQLPTGLTYESSSIDLGTYDSLSGIWDVGNMPPSVSVQLVITAKVTSAAALVNTAEVISVDEGDPDSTPNNHIATEDDQATITFNPGPPVDIQVLQATALADASNRLTITYKIVGGTASPFSFGAYGSKNATFDVLDTQIGAAVPVSNSGDLTPGTHTISVNGNFLVPGLANINNAFVLVTADPENQTSDPNRTNNTQTLTGLMYSTVAGSAESLIIRGNDRKTSVTVAIVGKQLIASMDGVNRTVPAANVSQIVIVTGNSADTIIALGGKNVLVNSGGGDDTITTGRGNDTVISGTGNDIIFTDGGNDNISTGDGNDFVAAGNGDDVVDAGANDDTIFAGEGDDLIRGGLGNDHLYGGLGNDVLLGGDGDDSLFDYFGRNLLVGGLGKDDLHSLAEGNLLIGGATKLDSDDISLRGILAEWKSNRTVDARIKNLTQGGGLNGTTILVRGSTFVDDHAEDKLFGGVRDDWFIVFDLDKTYAQFRR